MSQLPPANPAWCAMRAKHGGELCAFKRKVETEKRVFDRRVDAAHADLLARHAHQEREFWQHATNTSGCAGPAPQSVAPNTQSTTSRPSTAPAYPHQKPSPTLGPPRKHQPSSQPPPIFLNTCDSPRRQSQTTVSVSASPQQPNQPLKPSSKVLHPPSPNKKQTPTMLTGGPRPPEPNQYLPRINGAHPPPIKKQECETIDLCSDDDDVLVEVTKAAYQKNTVRPPPFRPGIPTATFQLFGEKPSFVKRENVEAGQSTQGQSTHPQPVQNTTHKPTTNLPSAYPPRGIQTRDSATLNALAPIVSQRAATAIPPQGQAQAPSQPACNKTAPSCDNKDDDVDIENVPLGKCNHDALEHCPVQLTNAMTALLNMKAALKKLGVKTPKDHSMDVDSSVSAVGKSSTTTIDVQKTHLPSPSPSVTSTSAARKDSEVAALLHAFKKPVLPTLGGTCNTQTHPPISRASSRTLAATQSSEGSLQGQREESAASRVSTASTSSRKRKEFDLSDDEQTTYTPSKSSPVTERQKSATLFGSSRKSSRAAPKTKWKGPPLPSAFPISPVGKKTNGFGFRTAIPATPAIPPRTPPAKSKPETARKPTQTPPSKKLKASSTTPGKRTAAVKAQEKIQQISVANEEFHTEDEIHRASTREARRGCTTTTDLGRRLRSMSITPVPTGIQLSGAPKDSAMADTLPRAAGTVAEASKDNAIRTRERPSKDGTTRDRLAARNRDISKLIGDNSDDDYEDDVDISEFTYVNGIIIQAGQEGRLAETAD